MRALRWWDYITVNIYWLGLNIASGSLTPYIYPILVVLVVGEESKNTALGGLRAASLAVAILMQAAFGLLSDRSTLRWGRRRPFIVAGTLLDMVLAGAGGRGRPGLAELLAAGGAVMLLQVSSNMAHGALQGLIPDVIPEKHRGKASGIKAAFELLPIILVGLTIARYVKANTWGAILTVMGALFVGMLLTLPVREEPPAREAGRPGGAAAAADAAAHRHLRGGDRRSSAAWWASWARRWRGPARLQLVAVAVAGLVAMAGSIILGVYWSARVGIGEGAQEHPAYVWWVINRLLFLAAVGSVQGFAQYFLGDVLKLPDPAAATGNLMLVVGVSTLIAALSSGLLADRFGRRRLVAVAGLVAALGTFLLVLSPNMTMVLISGCLIGVAAGAFLTSNWALGTDLVPAAEAGDTWASPTWPAPGRASWAPAWAGPWPTFSTRPARGWGTW